jgi:hypothetical protein
VRLQWGAVPTSESASANPDGWRPIDSSASGRAYWLAALAGLALLGGLCSALSVWSWVARNQAGMATAGDAESPQVAASVALALFIPLHELLHLLGQPDWGTTSRSVLAIWPSRLRFGVYYEGCMSRRRWLGMRLAPFLVLSVLPACLVALLQVWPWTPDIEVGLQVMMLVNALGSGGDIVAALLVLRQVPATGQLCFQSGRAYWRPA